MKALIIGGGIAGPVLGLALRKAGIEATIHEAYATPADGLGGTLMLAPNGLDALRIIGVDASAIGQPIHRMVISDGSGKQLAEFPTLPELPPSQVMWRSELYRALHDRARAEGIPIQFGKRLVNVEERATGLTARFDDGSVARGDVLIGADGIRSTVRRLIDPSAPGPRYVGFLGFGGLAEGSGAWQSPDAMHFVFGKRAFLGHWSRPDGGVLWFSNLPFPSPLSLAQAREVPAAEWLRRMRELYAEDVPGRDLVEHTDPEQLFVAGAGEILPAIPRWHRGRMVLVGDSAHAPSSSSGQGASLAIESAIELARCLRDQLDPSAAFATFEALRRPRVARVAAYAARQNSHKVSGPVGKAVMRVLMPLAAKTVMTPERMFGWMHRHRIDWNTHPAV